VVGWMLRSFSYSHHDRGSVEACRGRMGSGSKRGGEFNQEKTNLGVNVGNDMPG